MAASKLSDVIQHLRKIVLLRDDGGLTDRQLLDEFIGRRENAALAALVARHGPMVWGVCSRTLRNNHDAEDAFQSTFLVFVRKAASVTPKDMIGNWLYGVARQTALNAKAAAMRRRNKERHMTDMPAPPPDDNGRDLLPYLDQELSRLPDKYRAVIILCDLEGKTRKEAARQFGLPEGTVATRLAKARALLAKRLARHGGELSSGALAAVLSEKVASAGVPATIVSSTIKATTSIAAGQAASSVISAQVVALAEGVLKGMLLKQLKVIAAILLIVGSAATYGGGRLLTHDAAVAQQVDKPKQQKVEKKRSVEAEKDVADDVKPIGQTNAAAPVEKELLPEGAIARLGEARFKNLGRPYSLVFGPDSKTLAVGCWDGTLSYWNLDTLKLNFQWEGHAGPIYAVAISPDGNALASAGEGNEIRIRQLSNGKQTSALPGSDVSSLQFSPDGSRLVCIDGVNLVVWDLATKVDLCRISRGFGSGSAVFHDDATVAFLAYAGRTNGTIEMIDARTGNEQKRIKAPDVDSRYRGHEINALSPTGKWLVGFLNADFYAFNVPGRIEVRYKDERIERLDGLTISPDERFAAIAFNENRMALVELTTGRIRREWQRPEHMNACLAVSADGRYLASGGVDQSVVLWDLTGRGTNGKLASVNLSGAELDRFWTDLDAADGAAAHRAVWALTAAARDSVPYLRGKLILPRANPQRVASLVRDLEDNAFKVRQQADAELEKLSSEAEAALRKRLADAPTLEGRRRIEQLLERMDKRWNKGQMTRAIEVLERAGTADARALLLQLSQSDVGSRRSDEAGAALRRLNRTNAAKRP